MSAKHDRSYAEIESAASARAGVVARETAKAGGDVAAAAESFLLEVMRGARSVEDRALSLIEHAAGSFVKSALEEGLDPGAAAKGLVEGAAVWTREWGRGTGTAAAMTAQGAIDAADQASPETGRKVRAALNGRTPGEPQPAGSTGERQ